MEMKFASFSAIMLFAFTLTFVGCGREEKPAPPPPPPAAPEAPTKPAPPVTPEKPEKMEEKKGEAKTK